MYVTLFFLISFVLISFTLCMLLLLVVNKGCHQTGGARVFNFRAWSYKKGDIEDIEKVQKRATKLVISLKHLLILIPIPSVTHLLFFTDIYQRNKRHI